MDGAALPPPPPLLKHLPTVVRSSSSPSPSLSVNASILILVAILATIVIASASIHLFLRFLSSRRRRSSASAVHPGTAFIHTGDSSSATSDSSSLAGATGSSLSEKERSALIESLPLFSLASSLATLPKSSPDCAVCQYPFHPDDELRLLPACHHAFHSSCVDPWLRTTPSCPLCRTSITLPPKPLPLPPPAPPLSEASDGINTPRSSSFRIEIGRVSSRRTAPDKDSANSPVPHRRTYSLGSSFEYLVEDELEVEAVVARVSRRSVKTEKRETNTTPAILAPGPPGDEVADAAGASGRGWLREYVDRLTSSASSPFSSFRFSGRWSNRYDDGTGGRHAAAFASPAWDLEGNARPQAEESAIYGFYRWLVGAY